MTPRDSPAIRTRWAWMRTALATAAVGALTARGVLVRGGSGAMIGVVVVTTLVLIALSVVRARQLTSAEATVLTSGSGASRTVVGASLAVIVLLSTIAIGTALT